jgi:hypothetical protein
MIVVSPLSPFARWQAGRIARAEDHLPAGTCAPRLLGAGVLPSPVLFLTFGADRLLRSTPRFRAQVGAA